MSELTIKELEKIIRRGDFNALIGKMENDFLDCKREIYHLKNDENKRKLAKDVSSFANLDGGYILIGLETKHSDTHLGDEIVNLCLLEQNIVDTNQYYNIIRDWVYPEINGLGIRWKASKNDSKRGIVVIKIPLQQEAVKPFLIKKIIDERKTSEIMFGYAERKVGRSETKKIQDIHRTLQDGLLYDKNIEKRFDALEAILQPRKPLENETKEITEKQVDIESIIKNRTDEALTVNDMKNERAIILVAYADALLGELGTLFSNKAGSTKRLLENPPIARRGGWTLETKDVGKIIRGELVRVTGFTKTIDLYKDGTLILVGDLEGYLCHWQSGNIIKINPLAMIELVYNFVLFYNEVIKDFIKQPSKMYFKFGFINLWLNDIKNYLIPGPHNSIDQMIESEKYLAQEAYHFSKPIDCSTDEFDVGNIAYEIVEQIYLWFGIMPEGTNIPYTKIVGETVSVDIDQIKKI